MSGGPEAADPRPPGLDPLRCPTRRIRVRYVSVGRRFTVALLMTLGGRGASHVTAVATASARWPVIGCYDLNVSGFNHFAWKYKPSRLCYITGTLAGIDHVHWKHWGKRQATGTGDFVDSLAFHYPAKLTVSKLTVTHNNLGLGTYAAWYSRLHVVAKRERRGGIFRGPVNATLNVTPWE